MHVRNLGDWTGRLQELAERRCKEQSAEQGEPPIKVYMEGPYGTPEVDLFGEKAYARYLVLLLRSLRIIEHWFRNIVNSMHSNGGIRQYNS